MLVWVCVMHYNMVIWASKPLGTSQTSVLIGLSETNEDTEVVIPPTHGRSSSHQATPMLGPCQWPVLGPLPHRVNFVIFSLLWEIWQHLWDGSSPPTIFGPCQWPVLDPLTQWILKQATDEAQILGLTSDLFQV